MASEKLSSQESHVKPKNLLQVGSFPVEVAIPEGASVRGHDNSYHPLW